MSVMNTLNRSVVSTFFRITVALNVWIFYIPSVILKSLLVQIIIFLILIFSTSIRTCQENHKTKVIENV
jgi:hypothetical protein